MVSLYLLQYLRCVCACVLCSVMSRLFVTSWTVQPVRFLCPCNFPGNNTGMGCLFPPPGELRDSGIKPASFTVSCIGTGILYHCSTWIMGSYCFDLSQYPSDPTLITVSPHLQNCVSHTHTTCSMGFDCQWLQPCCPNLAWIWCWSQRWACGLSQPIRASPETCVH